MESTKLFIYTVDFSMQFIRFNYRVDLNAILYINVSLDLNAILYIYVSLDLNAIY